MSDGEGPEVILGVGVVQNRRPRCLGQLGREARELVYARISLRIGDEGQPAILGAKYKSTVSGDQKGFLGFPGIACPAVETAAELTHALMIPEGGYG
jgi:hypothetical protein